MSAVSPPYVAFSHDTICGKPSVSHAVQLMQALSPPPALAMYIVDTGTPARPKKDTWPFLTYRDPQAIPSDRGASQTQSCGSACQTETLFSFLFCCCLLLQATWLPMFREQPASTTSIQHPASSREEGVPGGVPFLREQYIHTYKSTSTYLLPSEGREVWARSHGNGTDGVASQMALYMEVASRCVLRGQRVQASRYSGSRRVPSGMGVFGPWCGHSALASVCAFTGLGRVLSRGLVSFGKARCLLMYAATGHFAHGAAIGRRARRWIDGVVGSAQRGGWRASRKRLLDM